MRRVSDFKVGNNILISDNDAPIVRNLLMCSIDDECPAIVDWFNGALDLQDSYNCVTLFWHIKEPIMRAEMMGETDNVTVDEWISSIRGLINYDMAENTIKMKNKLEEFRTKTLVKNNITNCGDVIVTNEDGGRHYALQGNRQNRKLSDSVLQDIVDSLYLQSDYFSVLEQIMDYMIKDAEKKALPDIEVYALAKNLSECESAVELVKEQNGSMVSEYYPWFHKMGAYLKDHPDVATKIQEKTKTENLTEFFLK